MGHEMDMETVSASVLADTMSRFYCEARPKNSEMKENVQETVYHKNNLINIRPAINRHLADLKRGIDICRDKEWIIGRFA